LGKAAARLHAIGGNAIDHRPVADDVVGLGKGGIDRSFVAGLVKECLVVWVRRPHRRRARGQRGLGGGHRRQWLVIDLNQFGGVPGLVEGLGDDKGDRIADIAHNFLREDRLRAHKSARAVAALARHQRAQRTEPAACEVVAKSKSPARRAPTRQGSCRSRRFSHARAANAARGHALRSGP
jgi:hypothetical protein